MDQHTKKLIDTLAARIKSNNFWNSVEVEDWHSAVKVGAFRNFGGPNGWYTFMRVIRLEEVKGPFPRAPSQIQPKPYPPLQSAKTSRPTTPHAPVSREKCEGRRGKARASQDTPKFKNESFATEDSDRTSV